MTQIFLEYLKTQLTGLHSDGLYKSERVIVSKQAGEIELTTGEKVLNFCANNYLGLANNAELVETGKLALDRYGYGMASVRFICGTQEEHKQLEGKISSFLKMEDTILYSSCFDANKTIADVYAASGVMIDPHTAVALAGSRSDNHNDNVANIILSTAHPAKFPDAVEKATGHKPHMPSELSALFDLDEFFSVLPNDLETVEEFIKATTRANHNN